MSSTPDGRAQPGRNLGAGLLLGLGIVAFFDETVFHQLLHWHHFYDRSTTDVGLVSDGLFHAFSWFATVAALFLLAQLRRERTLHVRRFVGGLLVGAGAFQLYDGLVQRKAVRVAPDPLRRRAAAHDLVWNITAGVLLVVGAALVLTTRTRQAR